MKRFIVLVSILGMLTACSGRQLAAFGAGMLIGGPIGALAGLAVSGMGQSNLIASDNVSPHEAYRLRLIQKGQTKHPTAWKVSG